MRSGIALPRSDWEVARHRCDGCTLPQWHQVCFVCRSPREPLGGLKGLLRHSCEQIDTPAVTHHHQKAEQTTLAGPPVGGVNIRGPSNDGTISTSSFPPFWSASCTQSFLAFDCRLDFPSRFANAQSSSTMDALSIWWQNYESVDFQSSKRTASLVARVPS